MNQKTIGQQGEMIAEQYLHAQGYQLLKRNYHCRFGEIDIIALSRNHKKLVFVEVKTRKTRKFGAPQDAVDRLKINKIFKTIIHFQHSTTQKIPKSWQLDVIAIELNHPQPKINHLKDILGI